MAMKCQKKKELINMKRKESENVTSGDVLGRKRTTTIPKKQITSTIDSNIHAEIFTFMLHAHFLNSADPGTYENELNKTLKENNLPTVKIPTVPDSIRY